MNDNIVKKNIKNQTNIKLRDELHSKSEIHSMIGINNITNKTNPKLPLSSI